jgi:hypothetical protein
LAGYRARTAGRAARSAPADYEPCQEQSRRRITDDDANSSALVAAGEI